MQKMQLLTEQQGIFSRHPGIPHAGSAGTVQPSQHPAFMRNRHFLF
jgi:hypothetical protein